jgi:hypothetical protein
LAESAAVIFRAEKRILKNVYGNRERGIEIGALREPIGVRIAI